MLWSALLLGFAGSLHCLGMCSPLAIAATSMQRPFLINRLVYNMGRILTYGILGIIVSSMGSVFQVSKISDILSIGLGSVLILVGLGVITRINVPIVSKVVIRFSTMLKQIFTKFLAKKNVWAMGGMGMINGLLPCGLTYIALVSCLGSNSGMDAFLVMVVFGVGTLPVMLGLTSLIKGRLRRFNFNARKVTMVTMICVGILLLARGFYHSPYSSQSVTQVDMTICR